MSQERKKAGRMLGAKVTPINEGDQPLASLISNSLSVSVFLVNGVKLTGQIIWADDAELVLRGDRDQLINRGNIATVLPEVGVFFI